MREQGRERKLETGKERQGLRFMDVISLSFTYSLVYIGDQTYILSPPDPGKNKQEPKFLNF